MNLFDITGKKAIITGGTRGLGHGIAEGFLEAGAEVVIFGSNDDVKKVAENFRNRGFKCEGIKVNLADRKERELAFYDALEVLGGIDILVNSAGIQRRNNSELFTESDWDDVIEINLTAPFHLCQLAGKEFLKAGYGKIINISSMLAFFGGLTVPAYAASKGGVSQFTRALCNEWASKGINVNAIAPGYMATKMNEALLDEQNPRYADITKRIPAKRWGTPEDMKGVAIFLASKASDYLNGAIIPCDGGYLSM